MKINLETSCNLKTCPYNSKNINSHCIWDYSSSKKSVSVTELSLILNQNKNDIDSIVKKAKTKIIKEVSKQKLLKLQVCIKYCYKCGKAYSIKLIRKNLYVCKKKCTGINYYTNVERIYNKPISHILVILSSLMNIGMIANLLKLANKSIREMFVRIFGDDTLLKRRRDLRECKFKKRKEKLNFKLPFARRIKSLSFSIVNKKIKNFNKVDIDLIPYPLNKGM